MQRSRQSARHRQDGDRRSRERMETFASQRETFGGRRAEIATRATIAQIERSYVGTLNELEKAVRNLNQEAQHTESGIVQARAIVAGSVVLSIIAGSLFGYLFAQSDHGPLVPPHRPCGRHSHERRIEPALRCRDGRPRRRDRNAVAVLQSHDRGIGRRPPTADRFVEAEIRTQYERLNAAINNMPQGLCMFDAEQKLIICNRRYAEILTVAPSTRFREPRCRRFSAIASKATVSRAMTISSKTRLAIIAERKPFISSPS